MAATFNPTELDTIADYEAGRSATVSLHTADPGTTGASEATGGSPAYARQALTFAAAASGSAVATEVTFDVPTGTYTHFGTWDSSGVFLGGNALATAQTLTSQGQVKVTVTVGPVAGS